MKKTHAGPLVAALTIALVCGAGTRPTQTSKPASNLDFWLSQAENATSAPAATKPDDDGTNPFRPGSGFRRADALPGVIQLSDGTLLAGGIYTTLEKPLSAFVEREKRWRRVPLIAVLGVSAVVVEEKMEPRWRWKAMGEPERVYTGKSFPTRRLLWRFHLIDDTVVTGAVKGQPLWVEQAQGKRGPFILHERSKGPDGQSLKDLVYAKRIIISRRMMEQVLQDQAKPAAR